MATAKAAENHGNVDIFNQEYIHQLQCKYGLL